MEVRKAKYTCEDCGFYHDCPLNYDCPAKKMIKDLCSREGGIFTVIDGSIVGLFSKEEEEEE